MSDRNETNEQQPSPAKDVSSVSSGGERVCTRTRTTSETDIVLTLNLDGTGETNIATGIAFFDHMLEAFGRHGLFDLDIAAKGDLEVDAHHTVEDVGIVLGQAFAAALENKQGITRFGSSLIPMDEALVLAACDLSGRGQLHYDVKLPIEIIGTFDTTLAKEFFIAFANNAGVTLHIRSLVGENSHHIIEAAFKAVARALMAAVALNPRIAGVLPSTKGSLS
ncbi:MAG: imidazoleglycerol-phosphate dehydratase HisB [Coriobacteriaceae bacterium]|jgi:imidazoleglycerol-phosphate dehydratase|nr:imidazoleglycerol-phosphate dehydratase HisB [Coriobacteriaceae bacterium]